MSVRSSDLATIVLHCRLRHLEIKHSLQMTNPRKEVVPSYGVDCLDVGSTRIRNGRIELDSSARFRVMEHDLTFHRHRRHSDPETQASVCRRTY
jgi:hypothetical protein